MHFYVIKDDDMYNTSNANKVVYYKKLNCAK